jgi:hypothetical protein
MRVLSLPFRVSFLASLVLFVSVCLPMRSVWSRTPRSLAAELARLRSEVETLSSKVQDKKEAYRNRRRVLSMKKANLALSVQRAQLRLNQLTRKKTALEKARKQASKSQKALIPVLSKGLVALKQRIKAGLPFRIKDRLAALNKLEARFKGGLLKPRVTASRLWQFVEDELRLSRENGIYRQTIRLHNKTLLVEVARIGMVMLFFKTRQHRFGKAVKRQGQWKFVLLQNEQEVLQVKTLFDALKKQIRVGFWKLPNTLPRR